MKPAAKRFHSHSCRKKAFWNLLHKAALLVASCALAAAQPAWHLRNGDTVVFYGDSITEQRLYTTFVETFSMTRFPRMNVQFVHSGWGGDRVSGGGGGPIDIRLQRDVLAFKPTVVTIMLGMNDGRYQAFDQAIYDEYTSGYRRIIDTLRKGAPGVRITIIEPSPFDDVTRKPNFPGGYNAVLVRFGQFLRTLGRSEGLTVADLNTPVVESLKRAWATDPANAEKIVPDRVHPGAAGHLLMAAALLKAWNAPAIVSSVEIDGSAGALLKAENSAVSDLRKGDGLRWTQTDSALPLPIDDQDPVTMLAVRSSDIERALNWQPLRVTGLPRSRYTLRIDGEPAGSFTSAQLGAGVNLAMLPTPMARQAANVHQLTLKRTAVRNTKWRNLQVPFEKDSFTRTRAAVEALDALEAEIAAQQRAAAVPRARRFELLPE